MQVSPVQFSLTPSWLGEPGDHTYLCGHSPWAGSGGMRPSAFTPVLAPAHPGLLGPALPALPTNSLQQSFDSGRTLLFGLLRREIIDREDEKQQTVTSYPLEAEVQDPGASRFGVW